MENIPVVETLDSILGDDRSNAGPLWDKWIKSLENYMVAIDLNEDLRKRLLCHLIGA